MLVRYPSTTHLAGSKHAAGPGDPSQAPFPAPGGLTLVWEEKVDGDHLGFGFAPGDGRPFLQAHGREVDVAAERSLAPAADWLGSFDVEAYEALGERFVVFGDWCALKHTVFYDALPHPFLEYDVFDRVGGAWLSTAARRRLLAGLPVSSVPVLHEGRLDGPEAARALLAPGGVPRRSAYKTGRWREALDEAARAAGLDPGRVAAETDPSDAGEGLYLKVEERDRVVGRHKFVRPGFMETILASGSHWRGRRPVRNAVAAAMTDAWRAGGE